MLCTVFFFIIFFKNNFMLWLFQTYIYKHTCSLLYKGMYVLSCFNVCSLNFFFFFPLTAIDLVHSLHLEFLHAWRINLVTPVSLQLSKIMKPFTEDEGGLNIHSTGTASTALPLPLIARKYPHENRNGLTRTHVLPFEHPPPVSCQSSRESWDGEWGLIRPVLQVLWQCWRIRTAAPFSAPTAPVRMDRCWREPSFLHCSGI